MLADLFYLSVIWLVLGLVTLLALGTRLRHSNFLSSLLCLFTLVSVGDLISLVWFGGELGVTLVFSIVIGAAGIFLILMLKDWNAAGQDFSSFAQQQL